jgi:hypothetical protein
VRRDDMPGQQTLFDAEPPQEAARGPGGRRQMDVDNQRARIVERLRKGPATNLELATTIGLRFGARLKELRDAGYRIRSVCESHEDGRWRYELEGEPPSD